MKLIIDTSGKPNNTGLALHADSSFGAEKRDEFFDYQVGLDASGKIALNFKLSTEECVSVEGYSTDGFLGFKKSNLIVPNSTNCSLKMILSESDPPEWGTTFLIHLNGCYIDFENKRLQFGTPKRNCVLFRFGLGQYAYCRGDEIEAILIAFVRAEYV